MPKMSGTLGTWEVKHLHYWKERGALPTAKALPLIAANTRVATIGSCFAVEIVRVLQKRGVQVGIHPAGLWYNTFSIAQEFAHIFQESPYANEPLWQTSAGEWMHPFKDYHKQFATREALLDWSDEIDRQSRELFTNADVIIITLGLTEIWESIRTSNVFIQLPPPEIYAQGVARFRPSTFAENLANLERIYALVRSKSSAHLILTVSPVPLYATFRDMDVRIANNISKSTLRAAAADFIAAHDDVHYFHSYEIVTAVDSPGLFMKEDKRHVREAGVELIMDEFLKVYGAPTMQSTTPPDLAWLESTPEQPKKCASSPWGRARRMLDRLLRRKR